ncbi:hypothetical protein RN001_000957 [Aquatica leii]|uniref:Uncharacterized protein n=1 Tax=Aquatica leii TaxID=1421715 RepID=A0AAN7SCH6_9COLE|nr:hypothetical protein RN001_000957 [Aquatica leii]
MHQEVLRATFLYLKLVLNASSIVEIIIKISQLNSSKNLKIEIVNKNVLLEIFEFEHVLGKYGFGLS